MGLVEVLHDLLLLPCSSIDLRLGSDAAGCHCAAVAGTSDPLLPRHEPFHAGGAQHAADATVLSVFAGWRPRTPRPPGRGSPSSTGGTRSRSRPASSRPAAGTCGPPPSGCRGRRRSPACAASTSGRWTASGRSSSSAAGPARSWPANGAHAARLDRFMADRLRGPQHRRPSERNFALAAELRGVADRAARPQRLRARPGRRRRVRPGRDGLRTADAARPAARPGGDAACLPRAADPARHGEPAARAAPRSACAARRAPRRQRVVRVQPPRPAQGAGARRLDRRGDHAGVPRPPRPGVGSRERALRGALHAVGIRGRSAAIRARPLQATPG